MAKFHESLILNIYQCEICKEAWPNKIAFTVFKCCKADKKVPKKFSSENNMTPSSVPVELHSV